LLLLLLFLLLLFRLPWFRPLLLFTFHFS
jgi:hypothetical protein